MLSKTQTGCLKEEEANRKCYAYGKIRDVFFSP